MKLLKKEIILDGIRWILALISFPIVFAILFVVFTYPFEWLLIFTTGWFFVFYLLFWIIFGALMLRPIMSIGTIIPFLSAFLVRQSTAYISIFMAGLYLFIFFLIYSAWSANIQYSWELLPYQTSNRILFTILALILSGIPIEAFNLHGQRLSKRAL